MFHQFIKIYFFFSIITLTIFATEEFKATYSKPFLAIDDTIVYSAVFSPEEKYLVAGGTGALTIWDVATAKVLKIIDIQKSGSITALSFSADGKYLLSSGEDEIIRMWNTKTWEIEKQIEANKTYDFLLLSIDGKYILSGYADSKYKHWDYDSQQYKGESNKFTYQLWESSSKKELKLTNTAANKKLNEFGFKKSDIKPLSINLAINEQNKFHESWKDIEGRDYLNTLIFAKYSPSKRYIISSSMFSTPYISRHALVLRDTKTMKGKVFKSAPLLEFTSMAIHPSNGELLTMDDRGIKLWDVENGKFIKQYFDYPKDKEHGRLRGRVNYNNNGDKIVASTLDEIVIIESNNSRVIKNFEYDHDEIGYIKFSLDDKYLFITERLGLQKVINIEKDIIIDTENSSRLVESIKYINDEIKSIKFNLNDKYLLVKEKIDLFKVVEIEKNSIYSKAVIKFLEKELEILKKEIRELNDSKYLKKVKVKSFKKEIKSFEKVLKNIKYLDINKIMRKNDNEKYTLFHYGEYVQYDKNMKLFYSVNYEGTIDIKNINTNEKILKMINLNDEWISMTPEGYFTGSKGAFQYLNITKYTKEGMEPFDFSQLYDHFFRPDLVKLKLSGDEEAFQKVTGGLTYQDALQNPPPKLAFKSIDEKLVETSGFEYKLVDTKKEIIKLTFNVKEHDGGGIGLIRVYQEGKLIQTIGEGKVKKQSANIDTIIEQENIDKVIKQNQEKLKKEKNERLLLLASLSKAVDKNIELSVEDIIAKVETESTTNNTGIYELELELKSGKNQISIEAFNKTNTVTSYRENITINANIPKQAPKLYAIVAGVNEFEAPSVTNLKYSQNDAQAIKEAAEKKMNTVFDDVEVIYLTGKEVTKENILKAAQEISNKAKLDDTILFYISTHGRAARGKLYLVPHNNKSVKNWIDFEQTFQAVQSIKALNQIFIIDACESGKANDIVSSVYDSRASVLAKSSGVHMLLATTKGTSAFEHPDPTVKNGVFTHRILEAMNDTTTDANKDKLISIKELSTKLKEPSNNADYQYPVIRNVGKDVQLGKMD